MAGRLAAQPLSRDRFCRQGGIAAPLLAGGVVAALIGCSAPHPFIRNGDAKSVDISYSGDVATALPLAREHCARFERKPQLVDPGADIATFECVGR